MNYNDYLDNIIQFVKSTKLNDISLYYYDALLNYLSVTHLGSKTQIIRQYASLYNDGNYHPIGRKETMSIAHCIMMDCFSSAINAFDDIDFISTSHPCGPIASALLGVARISDMTVHDLLEALCIGMEVEVRLGELLFSKGSSYWYTTGIVGGIGVAAALAHYYQFDEEEIKDALSHAANMACGNRGTHGSPAGSYVPALSSIHGYHACQLSKAHIGCHDKALEDLILMMNPHPNYELKDLGKVYQSENVSFKPYPYGFITFGLLSIIQEIEYHGEELTFIISDRVYQLGHNAYPKDGYEALVSLPYVCARVLTDSHNLYRPIEETFSMNDKERDIIQRIHLKVDDNYSDDDITLIINDTVITKHGEDIIGTNKRPLNHKELSNKIKSMNIFTEKQINNFYLLENEYVRDVLL